MSRMEAPTYTQVDLPAIDAVPVTEDSLMAEPAGFAAALRRAAFDRRRAAHDSDDRHLLDAATSAQLIEPGNGPAFDDGTFGEPAASVAELVR